MVVSRIGEYEFSFTDNGRLEFMFANVFPDQAPSLPYYHWILEAVGDVYSPPQVAELFDGPARMGVEKGFGVKLIPSDHKVYLQGLGVNEEAYQEIDSPEKNMLFEYGASRWKISFKKTVIRPLPKPDPDKLSKFLHDFFKNPRTI